jgi:hypothetical protein
MSAADDAREHLTATIWEVLRNYTDTPRVHHADMIHTAAERYGHAVAEEVADEAAGAGRLKLATEEAYRRPA